MNPFFNKEEYRPRALLRVIVFLFFSIIIMGLSTSMYLYGFEYLITGALLFGFFAIMFRFSDQRVNLSEAGVKLSKQWMNEFGIGTLAAGLAMSFIFFVQWSSGDIELEGVVWSRNLSVFWLLPVFGYFLKMVGVGFYEELMFRSYLIPNIKEGLTFSSITPGKAAISALFLNSVLFGLAHIMNQNISFFGLVNIVLAGMMLTFPYLVSGRLSYSVGIHFSWNYFQGGVFGFRVSGIEPMHPIIGIKQFGNPVWTGGSFGPEGGIIGLIGILLVSIMVAGYIRKKKGKLELHPMFKRTFKENQESFRKADELA